MKTIGLIQAHYASWEGAPDFSLSRVGSKRAIEHVIERLRQVPGVDTVVIAVPDVAENRIFETIAKAAGVTCFFGSKENVLDRVRGAADSVGGELIVHVMGQHCFIDPVLLSKMRDELLARGCTYISMPDDFTPYFAGKVYVRSLLETVNAAIAKEPDTAVHFARFAAYIETHRDRFNATIYTDIPTYSEEYLRSVRKASEEMFADDRLHVVPAQASSVSAPLLETYRFAASRLAPSDRVLDVACGDGFGARLLHDRVKEVVAIDLNKELIAENAANNTSDNIAYEVQDACALSYPDASFDAVTAMEIIEHIPLDRVASFVQGVRRVLKPGGTFFCSTPQNSMGAIPVVPWHVKEYSLAEFKELLGPHFSTIKVYGAKSGGPLTEDEYGQKMLAVCQ